MMLISIRNYTVTILLIKHGIGLINLDYSGVSFTVSVSCILSGKIRLTYTKLAEINCLLIVLKFIYFGALRLVL